MGPNSTCILHIVLLPVSIVNSLRKRLSIFIFVCPAAPEYCPYHEWVKSFSHVRLFVTPWTVAHQAPLSMGFSRQGYWSGFATPSSSGSSCPGIKPASLMSSALAWGFFTTSATWKANSFPQLIRKLLSKIRLLRPLTWKGQKTPESTLSFYNEKTEALGTYITCSRSSNH